MASYDRSLNQTIDYLRKQKRAGRIRHWELYQSDSTRGMFGVRVSVAQDGAFMNQCVSATYSGRDLLSAAHRAVAEFQIPGVKP